MYNGMMVMQGIIHTKQQPDFSLIKLLYLAI